MKASFIAKSTLGIFLIALLSTVPSDANESSNCAARNNSGLFANTAGSQVSKQKSATTNTAKGSGKTNGAR